jgi:hypothetical protein
MSSSYSVLESLAERDRRVRREQNWKTVRVVAEWLLVAFLSGLAGAVIAFSYGIDYGRSQEKRRIENTPKQGFTCNREVLRACENQYLRRK